MQRFNLAFVQIRLLEIDRSGEKETVDHKRVETETAGINYKGPFWHRVMSVMRGGESDEGCDE